MRFVGLMLVVGALVFGCRSRDVGGSQVAGAADNPSGVSGPPDAGGGGSRGTVFPIPDVSAEISLACVDGDTQYLVRTDVTGKGMNVVVTQRGDPLYVMNGVPVHVHLQRERTFFHRFTLAGGASPLTELTISPETLDRGAKGRLDLVRKGTTRAKTVACVAFDPSDPNGAGVSN